jgi:hypothetical protein
VSKNTRSLTHPTFEKIAERLRKTREDWDRRKAEKQRQEELRELQRQVQELKQRPPEPPPEPPAPDPPKEPPSSEPTRSPEPALKPPTPRKDRGTAERWVFEQMAATPPKVSDRAYTRALWERRPASMRGIRLKTFQNIVARYHRLRIP